MRRRCRSRCRRWAGRAALLALALLGLGLAGGGGGEELLAAALAAWAGDGTGTGSGSGTGSGLANGAEVPAITNVSAYPASIPVLLSPEPCGPDGPFLLVLVPSAPAHAAQRQAVRDTWGRAGAPQRHRAGTGGTGTAPTAVQRPRNGPGTPENAPEVHENGPETPRNGPETLKNAPGMPKSDHQTPKNGPETLENAAETLKTAPKTPGNGPELPKDAPEMAKNAPETPKTAPETVKTARKTPGNAPQTPESSSKTPGNGPQTAKSAPETPGNGPETPGNGPETPGNGPETPGNAPEMPGNAPETPKSTPKTPKNAPETPGNGHQTPGNAPETPGNAPETPKSTPKTPKNAPETPGNAPETPGNGPETPGNGPETPGNGPETPGNGPETAGNGPEAPSVRTIFVLGLPPAGSPSWVSRSVRSEWRQHRDVLQGAFPDSYRALTLKTLLLLRWAASRCPGARFLLKADDDVFVNVPALTRALRAPALPARLYLGRVHWAVAPNRDPSSAHHVPATLYAPRRFPPYCSGTAYLLSRDGAAAVLGAAPSVPFVAPEDVWVGLCARRAGLWPRHWARLAGAMAVPPDPCCYREVMVSAHRVRPAGMRKVWGMMGAGRGGACGLWGRAMGVLRCRVMAAVAGGGGRWGGGSQWGEDEVAADGQWVGGMWEREEGSQWGEDGAGRREPMG